jgi:hypothetical protein
LNWGKWWETSGKMLTSPRNHWDSMEFIDDLWWLSWCTELDWLRFMVDVVSIVFTGLMFTTYKWGLSPSKGPWWNMEVSKVSNGGSNLQSSSSRWPWLVVLKQLWW